MQLNLHERHAVVREKILTQFRTTQNCVKQVCDMFIQNPEPRNDR